MEVGTELGHREAFWVMWPFKDGEPKALMGRA